MKLLLCVFLLTISCQVILCDDVNIARLINHAVPNILQAGVKEGKLPGGPYYVHHVIKSSIGAQDSHFTLDVRQLDNQTVVIVKATVDNNDWSVKTSCFTSKIGENVRAWTQGWEFAWLSYAPEGRSDNYCVYKIIEWLEFVPWNFYTLSAEQLVLESEIRVAFELLEEAKKGQFKETMDDLNPDIPAGPVKLGVGSDHYAVSQYIGQSKDGVYEHWVYSNYQPCSGDRRIWMNSNNNDI